MGRGGCGRTGRGRGGYGKRGCGREDMGRGSLGGEGVGETGFGKGGCGRDDSSMPVTAVLGSTTHSVIHMCCFPLLAQRLKHMTEEHLCVQ